MESRNAIKLIAALAVVILAAGLIASNGSTERVTEPTGRAIEKSASDAPVKEFVMQSYTEIIDGKYFPKFSPNEITVHKGDKVRIKITNVKGTHDFNIDEFGVSAETPLNEEVVVEFVADKSGSYEYYCSKTGHRQNGHWGTLKVLE